MFRLLSPFFPASFRSFVRENFIKRFEKAYKPSFSQCGEDMILDTILGKTKGFYVDIGANNPIVQSNTMYFYKKGWNGINLDATPGSMAAFNTIRNRDTNLEIAISSEEREMTFYFFKPSFYNSFDKRATEAHKDLLVGEKLIKTQTLSKILDQYLGNNEIDFMTVDTEGFDYDILQSNDWQKYRPKVIVVEYITYEKSEAENNEKVNTFLQSKGYTLFCNSPTNAFFLENAFLAKRFAGE